MEAGQRASGGARPAMAEVGAPVYALRPMNLAVIAPELPPARGGMETVASGLVSSLGAIHDVTVFTLPGATFLVAASMSGQC